MGRLHLMQVCKEVIRDYALNFWGTSGRTCCRNSGRRYSFKAICGSVAATVATFASVAIPEMDRYGYSKKHRRNCGHVGTLGVLLPPSVTLIIFGIVTNSRSAGFYGRHITSLIMSCCFILIIFGWCKINPSLGPRSEKYSWPKGGSQP